jgi:hypothetical protein
VAFTHGKDSHFTLDGTDISAFTDTSALERAVENADVTTYTKDDRAFIAGLRGHGIPLGGPWDPTLDAAIIGADDGAVVAFSFGPAGSTGGNVQYSGNCLFENYTVSNPVGGRVSWAATMRVTGVVTRDTF